MSYRGKQVIVTGCSSGMGANLAARLIEAGADVHGYDVAAAPDLPLASFTSLDLSSEASINAAALPKRVDRLFNCAGVSDSIGHTPLHVVTVNYVGTRAFTRRVAETMAPGTAIARIASAAGWGWPLNRAALRELITIDGFDPAQAWLDAHPELVGNGYIFSKEAVLFWTMHAGSRLIRDGIRINCICPGPTDSPMLEGIIADIGARRVDAYTYPIGRRARVDEQAAALLFLNSDGATFVNGVALDVDGGLHGAALAGDVDLAELIAEPVEEMA